MLQNLKNILLDILKKKGFPYMVLVDDGKSFGVQFPLHDTVFTIHILPTQISDLPYAIVINAPVVVGLKPIPNLLLYLLNSNLQIPLGGFGFFGDTVIYKHSITDNDLTEEELERILSVSANIVLNYANIIINSFGGRMALDFPPNFNLQA
ncbi:MAG: hypothetical protein ABIL16_07815 [candidate division WOR-3 bacterium]